MGWTKDYKTKNFGSGTINSPEFNTFFRKVKKELGKILPKLKLNKGYFYFSGFFTANNGQVFYISISDVRFLCGTPLLIRTAKSYTDFTGGRNQFITIDNDLTKDLLKYVHTEGI